MLQMKRSVFVYVWEMMRRTSEQKGRCGGLGSRRGREEGSGENRKVWFLQTWVKYMLCTVDLPISGVAGGWKLLMNWNQCMSLLRDGGRWVREAGRVGLQVSGWVVSCLYQVKLVKTKSLDVKLPFWHSLFHLK